MGGSQQRFVGREAELARLDEALIATRAGHGGVVLLDAPGGLGSSRLLDAWLSRLGAGGPAGARAGAGSPTSAAGAPAGAASGPARAARTTPQRVGRASPLAAAAAVADAATQLSAQHPLILRSDALPAWRGRPFEPLRVALERELLTRPAAEVAALLEPGLDVLAPILPGATGRSGLALRRAPAEHRGERSLEAIRALLGRLAGTRPLLLVVEDLHVSDAGTRSTVAFLARTLGDRPVLIVGSFRHDALVVGHPLRATLEAIEDGGASVTRLPLPAFDRAELAGLIEIHEGERPSAPLLLLVAERSAGSPLVAEEVLAARRELSTASLAVPLDQLVRARAARRSPACRQVLRGLALAEGPVCFSDIVGLAAAARELSVEIGGARHQGTGLGSGPHRHGDTGEVEARAGLAEALEAGFIVRAGDAGGAGAEPHYRFRHDMIADAMAADLLPPDRRRMHAAVAALPGGLAADAERHLLAAHEVEATRAMALVAADIAEEMASGADALGHLELAIELDPASAGDGARPLLLRAADAAAAAHDLQRAAAYVDASLVRPAVAGDRPLAAVHWERLGNLRWEAGDREGATLAFERARALQAGGSPLERARVLARIAQVHMLAGSFRSAARLGHDALDLVVGLEADSPERAVGAMAVAEGVTKGPGAALAGDAPRVGAATTAAGSDPDGGAPRVGAATTAAASAGAAPEGGAPRVGAATTAAGPDRPGAAGAAEAVRGHVICTLGVIDGWSGRTERSIERLTEALAIAEHLGGVDDAFRARANLATVLGLEGRRSEAVAVTLAGIAAAERDGLEDLHGNILRGQATDFLFSAGRWQEARQVAARALSWIPSGHPYVSAAAYFLVVDAEMTYGASAPRVLGRLLLELETVADAQAAIIAYLAVASMALWRADTADARRSVEQAWVRIRQTEDWVLQGRTAAIALAVAADIAVAARDRRDMGTLASVRAWAEGVLIEAERLIARANVDPAAFSRREAAAELATARAHWARAAGRDDPAAWKLVGATWDDLGRRYDAALARWREGAALLDVGSVQGQRREGREAAREPLEAAAATARELGAIPLLQAVHDLAERGRVGLPRELFAPLEAAAAAAADRGEPGVRVDVGRPTRAFTVPAARPGPTQDTFGLSSRERGVLAEVVAGRTNREIGERLFISEKTVGVHVGNILAKLGVAGRVEAATVALRLGLVDDLADATRRTTRTGGSR